MKLIFALLTLSASVIGFKSIPPSVPATHDASKGIALVELFTSEGCSSCPSAEEALMELASENRPNIYILEYHVDYWDRLGWKDPFSRNEFTARQQQYGLHFGLNSIYTPQAIVNGKKEFVGSDKRTLKEVTAEELSKATSNTIELHASSADNKTVKVDWQLPTEFSGQINIALLQGRAITEVKRGENAGRTLVHLNTVRALKTMPATRSGAVELPLPNGLPAKEFRIVAFLQDARNLQITAVSGKGIDAAEWVK